MREIYAIEVINYDSQGTWSDVHTSGEGYARLEDAQEFLKSRVFGEYWSDTMMYGYGKDSSGETIRYNIIPITIR